MRRTLLLLFACLVLSIGMAKSPAFQPPIDIDQNTLLQNCTVATDKTCAYSLKDVLNSGGDFWTTPFQPYDPVTKTGDGYGEGPNGPRSAQRHAFNPHNPSYPYLRLNGLDSQSCFECDNSTGSYVIDKRGAMIRNEKALTLLSARAKLRLLNPHSADERCQNDRQETASQEEFSRRDEKAIRCVEGAGDTNAWEGAF